MTTVTLPEELTSYLLAHPDLFADVLAHAFATKQRHGTAPARTFGMHKTKRGDDDDLPPPKRARVVLPDGFQEDLVQDVRGVIYEKLTDLMDSDDEMLVALLHLGAVSTMIRAETAPLMKQFLQRTDLIGVVCRNVVMYFDQPRVRDLYIDALQYKAPAVYMAWKTLLGKPAWSASLTSHLVPIIHKDLGDIPYYIRSGRDPVFIFSRLLTLAGPYHPELEILRFCYTMPFLYRKSQVVAFAMDDISSDFLDGFDFDGLADYSGPGGDGLSGDDIPFLNDLFAHAARLGRLELFAKKILGRSGWLTNDKVIDHFLGAILRFGTGELKERIQEAVDLVIHPLIERKLTTATRAWTRFAIVLIEHGVSLDIFRKLQPDSRLMKGDRVLTSAVSWHRVDLIETFFTGPYFMDGLVALLHPPSDRIRTLSGTGQLATYEALMRAIRPSTDNMVASLEMALETTKPRAVVSNELFDRLTTTIPLEGEYKQLLHAANLAWKVATANVFDPEAWMITIERFEDVMATTDDAVIRARAVFGSAMCIDYGDPTFMRSLVKHFVAIYRVIKRRGNLGDTEKDRILEAIILIRLIDIIHWSNFWIYFESDIGLAFYDDIIVRRLPAYAEVIPWFLPYSAEPWRAVLYMLRTPRPKRWLRDVYASYLNRFKLLHPSAQAPAAAKFFVENLQAYADQSNGAYDEPINDIDDVGDLSFARDLIARDLEFFKHA